MGPTDHHDLFRKRRNVVAKALFGMSIQTHVFDFYTTLQLFLQIFSLARISTHIFKQQNTCFKYMYQTPPKLLYFMDVNSLVSKGKIVKCF